MTSGVDTLLAVPSVAVLELPPAVMAGAAGWLLVLLGLGVLVEGPVATVAAGSLAGAGVLDWSAVWAVAVVADVAADSAFYLLGWCGRRPWSARLIARLGLTEDRRATLVDRVTTGLPWVVLGAKLVDIAAIPGFVAAGLAGTPYRRFAAWVVPATGVRAAVLVAVGGLVGGSFAAHLVERPWLLVAAGVGIGLVLLVLRAATTRVITFWKGRTCGS